MNCPRDGSALLEEFHDGMEIDHCPTCNGRWLDHHQLDDWEAKHAPDPNTRRGMITYSKRQSELPCPICKKPMVAFNYRANPLELDTCEDEHGWWLDAGEEGRVADLIEQRVRDLYRAADAEASWGSFLQGLRGVKGKFKGKR